MGISVEHLIENLERGIQEFKKSIDLLPESLFLKKMDGWSPRDVTAHLIGWNLYTIKGCQQLRRGETPFYLIDPGDDFCKVNAVSIREYNSEDKARLLLQLDDATEKLKQFLVTVDPADWETDFNVKFKGEPVTVKNTIDALIYDFIDHRQQIEQWVKKVESV
jgi:hypothetical protein